MKIFFNSREEIYEPNTNLKFILIQKDIFDKKGIAVAVNETIIPKDKWETTDLNQNDKIIVITAARGG